MSKKYLLIVVVLSFIIIAGCGNIETSKSTKSSEVKKVSQHTPLKEIKESKIPGFKDKFNNIVKLEINFDPNGSYYRVIKPIQIEDSKIIFDILTMISQSNLISDESKINSMSGMATKNNKLFFINKNGLKKEITFAFDDPAFATGYLDIEGKKYDPGYSFFRYIRDFTEYNKFDTNIDNRVVGLFERYDWTVDYKINTVKEKLPENLKHEAGDFPTKIYWAYNNELSKNIAMDYSSYLGQNVYAEIYRLREPLPEDMRPRLNARGVVLKYKNKIIGAYIDAGRHDSFGCSLDRKFFKDITNKEWDEWIKDYIDYDNQLEKRLSVMNPEEIIKQYYEAMDSHDGKMQFACMTRKNLCSYLAMNMDNNKLFNDGFEDAFLDGKDNIKKAKLIKLSDLKGMENPEGSIRYDVTVDFRFKKFITSSDGIQPRSLILKKESQKSGWRIKREGI